MKKKKDLVRRLYWRRRAEGKCVRCGQPAARSRRGGRMAKCAQCLDLAPRARKSAP